MSRHTIFSCTNEKLSNFLSNGYLIAMQIMFPAYVSFAWVCYTIHTIKKKVFIYDPLASENGGAIKQLHMRNCNLLKSAMTEFAKTYFESWDFRFGDLEPAIIHPIGS